MHKKKCFFSRFLIHLSDLGPENNGLISIIAIFTLTQGVFNYGSFYLTGQIKAVSIKERRLWKNFPSASCSHAKRRELIRSMVAQKVQRQTVFYKWNY